MIGWFSKDARKRRAYQKYQTYEAAYQNAGWGICIMAAMATALFIWADMRVVVVPPDATVIKADVLGTYASGMDYLPETQTLAVGFATPMDSRAFALIEVTMSERLRLARRKHVPIRFDPANPRRATLAGRPPLNAVGERLRWYAWGLLICALLIACITPIRGAWLKRQRKIFAGYTPAPPERA